MHKTGLGGTLTIIGCLAILGFAIYLISEVANAGYEAREGEKVRPFISGGKM